MAKHYYIAKEKFKFIGTNKPEISQTAWERAVDQTAGLEWYEDTYTGQEDLRLNPGVYSLGCTTQDHTGIGSPLVVPGKNLASGINTAKRHPGEAYRLRPGE